MIQKFRGYEDESWNDWVTKFREVATACNWDAARQLNILPTVLDGHAREVFLALPAAQKNTMDNAVRNLGASFNTPEIRRLRASQFDKCVQLPYESCQAFADRLKKLLRESYPDAAPEIQQQLLLARFMSQIRAEFHMPILCANPQTLEQAVAAGKRFELQQVSTDIVANKAKTQQEVVGAIAAMTNVLAPKLNQIVRKVEETRVPAQGESYQEYARQSDDQQNQNWRGRGGNRARGQNRGRNDRTTDGRPICWNCDRIGHTSASC